MRVLRPVARRVWRGRSACRLHLLGVPASHDRASRQCSSDSKSNPRSNHDAPDDRGILAAWSACSSSERHQLLVLSVSGAMLNLGFGVIIPALPALSQQLGFGATGVGLLLAAPGLARVLCNLPAGALVDRVGRVPAMVVGQLAAAVGVLGTAFGSSLAFMLPFRFLGGCGGALAAAGSAAYLAEMTERTHLRKFRGTIVGAQGGMVAAAYVLGPAIGGFLTELYGAQTAYCVVGALIASCAGAFATLPETYQKSGVLGTDADLGVAQMIRDAARDWRDLLRDSNQHALFAANFALYLNYAATITVLPMQAFHTFGLTAGGVGALFSVASVVGILIAPAAGTFSDVYGRVPLLSASVFACALGCLGTACFSQWELFVASYLFWSVGEAVLSPLLIAYAQDIAPKHKLGSAMALSRQSGDLVFFLAPPALGILYDVCPGQTAMACTALLTAIGGVAFRSLATDIRSRSSSP